MSPAQDLTMETPCCLVHDEIVLNEKKKRRRRQGFWCTLVSSKMDKKHKTIFLIKFILSKCYLQFFFDFFGFKVFIFNDKGNTPNIIKISPIPLMYNA